MTAASSVLEHTWWSIDVHLAQQRADLAAVVAREVRAHPRAQVGGLADVEHAPAAVAEQVDAGRAGQRRR